MPDHGAYQDEWQKDHKQAHEQQKYAKVHPQAIQLVLPLFHNTHQT